MPPFQLKNVQGANKRNSHEHGDTGSAAPNSCRPNKTAPAASESRSYGNPEIGRRSSSVPIGAPRPTVAQIARTRIGARRHGKRSSPPADDTTSSVRCERAAPDEKILHLAAPPGALRAL